MKKHKFTGVGTLFFLCCLVLSLHLSIAQPNHSLQSLLCGASSDYQSILAELPDTELPKALAVGKALHFKALHQDSPLSLADVKQFKAAILARINRSQEVSLNQSDSFPHKVEAKEITLEGIRITIPAHYAASGELRILAVQPSKEAGSLLPEFIINYATANPPVRGKLLIDGKPYAIDMPTVRAVFFIPEMSPTNILRIGTHTACVSLVDTAKATKTFTWQFTVGMQPTPTEPIPETAKRVGSFSVEAGRVLKGAKPEHSVRVIVYESNNGQRYLVYEVHSTNNPSKMIARTRDPNWLRRILDPRRRIEEFLTLSPKTRYAFPGNNLVFTYSYSGPGVIKHDVWKIYEGSNVFTSEGPTVTRKLVQPGMFVQCTVETEETLPGGETSSATFSSDKTIHAMVPYAPVSDLAWGLFNTTGKGSIPLKGGRYFSIDHIGFEPLIPGKVFDYAGGILSVKRSAWQLGAGTGGVIANPATFTTEVHFAQPGVCEIVHDIALEYTFQNEMYRSAYKPEASLLAGVFKTQPKISFSQVPEGIIMDTSRKVTVKKIDLTIDGKTRTFSDADASWELARSSLFPDQPAIFITNIYPGFKTWIDTSFSADFRPLVTLQTGQPIENGMAKFQPLVKLAGDAVLHSHVGIPTATTLPIKAFDVEDLLAVKVDPEESEPILEGQEVTFEGTLAPLPDVGTGFIDETGGTIDFLHGYQSIDVELMTWWSWKEWEELSEKRDEVVWSYPFQADGGSGTYTLYTAAHVKIQEIETGDTALLLCSSFKSLTVLPGLNLRSPLGEFVYPMNISIPVETTYDKDLETWKKITWRLNGKKWEPGEDPKPWLYLDRTGLWSVHAKLDLSTGTTDLILTDTATFTVQPAEIRLSPKRKVVSLPGAPVSYNLNVLLNGQQIEDIGQAVEWEEEMLTAEVEDIEWGAKYNAPNVGELTPQDPPLTAELVFKNDGAATILATVTLRLRPVEDWKPTNKDPMDPSTWVFKVPALRGDAWAFESPAWLSQTGKFPSRAIKKTKRLFEFESGVVGLGKESVTWNPLEGLLPPIQKLPAIPGVLPARSEKISILWQEENSDSSTETTFAPKFVGDGFQTEVVLETALDFGSDEPVLLPVKKTKVSLSSLKDELSVCVIADPKSVSINEPSKVNFYFGEKNGALIQQEELYLWDKEYKITLDKVVWREITLSDEEQLSISTPEFSFKRKIPGTYFLSGEGFFLVEPKEGAEYGGKETILSDLTKVNVTGKIESWSVSRLSDHLHRIAIFTGADPKPYIECYKDKGPWVWKLDSSGSATQPLAVGCNSKVFLVPTFGGSKAGLTEVGFEWFTIDDVPVNLYGNVAYCNGATIPTPPIIGVYKLRLSVTGCNNESWISPVYVVYKVDERTSNQIYFEHCVADSTKAISFSGKINEKQPEKDLVDKFYSWWWSDKNELEYSKSARDTVWVIKKKGGWCEGLGNYFFKSLECQGISGLKRVGFRLKDIISPRRKISSLQVLPCQIKSVHPWTTEYWGGLVYIGPALNVKEPPFPYRIPYPMSLGHIYKDSKCLLYSGSIKIPPVSTQSAIISFPEDVISFPEPIPAYCFVVPDGHSIVLFQDSDSQKDYLYDPSFGEGTLGGIEVSIPIPEVGETKKTTIKELDKDPIDNGFWNYLTNSVGFLRCNTYFKSDNFISALGVFDIPCPQVNFLQVDLVRYDSKEDFE